MRLAIILTLIIVIFESCKPQKDQYSNVSDWAKDAVWYQIFPERFNNGDISNDPKPEDMIGGWPYEVQEGRQTHPWTSDWSV